MEKTPALFFVLCSLFSVLRSSHERCIYLMWKTTLGCFMTAFWGRHVSRAAVHRPPCRCLMCPVDLLFLDYACEISHLMQMCESHFLCTLSFFFQQLTCFRRSIHWCPSLFPPALNCPCRPEIRFVISNPPAPAHRCTRLWAAAAWVTLYSSSQSKLA